MKDFFVCLYDFLVSNKSINSVFGSRVAPLVSKDDVYPMLVYSPIGTAYDKNLQKESGFIRRKVQFLLIDNTFGGATKAGEIVRNVFKDFKGYMCGLDVQAVHMLTDETTVTEENEYMRVVEMEFFYNEP